MKIFTACAFCVLMLFGFKTDLLRGQSVWYWQNPVPQSNYLYNIFPSSDLNIYAVGQGGILQKTTNGGLNWSLYPTGIITDLRGLYFANQNTGYAAGASGKIFKTTNAGVNWVTQNSNTTSLLNSVFFRNQDLGWIVTATGLCLATTNGGNNWTSVSIASNEFRSVFFIDDNIGFAAGGQSNVSALYKTTNGGNNWTALNTGTASFLYSVFFVNNNTGWAAGQGQVVIKTTDGGTSWVTQNTGSGTSWLWSVKFINENTGWVSCLDKVFKTTNGGTNWNPVSVGLPTTGYNFSAIAVSPSETLYAAGTSGMIIKSTNAGDNWSRMQYGTSNNLSSVFFLNSNTGYACGYEGIIGPASIHKTTDGGNNWIDQTIPSMQNLYNIKFFNNNYGCAVGRSLRILVTTDGGSTWNLRNSGAAAGEELRCTAFKDSLNIFAGGSYFSSVYYSKLFKSTNGGNNWEQVSLTDSLGGLYSLQFINSTTAFACGNGGKIIKSTNGGNNWITLTSGVTTDFRSLYFINEQTGWTAGAAGVIRKTIDGGLTWAPQISNTTGAFTSIFFSSSLNGRVVGTSGVYKTTNGGLNWANDFIQANIAINSICFINDNTGWLAGNTGMIMKTTDGVTALHTKETSNPPGYKLHQNFPNPFNPETRIEYEIPVNSFVKLTIYDVTGKEVSILVNQLQSAGYHSYRFNAANLSSGIYFYRIETGEFSNTGKMILIK